MLILLAIHTCRYTFKRCQNTPRLGKVQMMAMCVINSLSTCVYHRTGTEVVNWSIIFHFIPQDPCFFQSNIKKKKKKCLLCNIWLFPRFYLLYTSTSTPSVNYELWIYSADHTHSQVNPLPETQDLDSYPPG